MVTNPQTPNEVKEVLRADIDQIVESPNSLMPEGLLNTLDAEEIADFLVPMLSIRRNKRSTAQQALEHFWIKNIDINDFNTCFVAHPRPETHSNGTNNNNADDDAAMEISTSEKK